eukprot:298775_1
MSSRCNSCKLCNVSADKERLFQCHNNKCDMTPLFCAPCGEYAHQRKKHNFIDHMKLFKIKEDEDLSSHLESEEDDTKYDEYRQNTIQQNVDMNHQPNISMTTLGTTLGVTTLGACLIAKAAPAAAVGIGLSALSYAVPAVCTYAYLKTLEPLCSQFCPTDAQKQKELEMTAVAMFQFHEDDINNEDVFNIKEINQRWHRFATLYHPDKKKNAEMSFIHMEIAKRILLSMKDPKSHPFPKDAHRLSTQSSCDHPIKKQIQWE